MRILTRILNRIKRFVTPPVFQDEDKSQTVRLLYTVLLTLFAATLTMVVLLLIVNGLPRNLQEVFVILIGLVVCLISLGLILVAQRGHVTAAGGILVSLLWLVMTVWVLFFAGVNADQGPAEYLIIVVLSGLLLGRRAMRLTTILTLLCLGIGYVIQVFGLVQYPGTPVTVSDLIFIGILVLLADLLLRSALHNLNAALAKARRNEYDQTQVNRELEVVRASLANRAQRLEAVVQVGRAAAMIRDQEQLLAQAADLISQYLDVYHVGIFMLDEVGRETPVQYAVLRASNSEGGKLMLSQGHRLRVGEQGIVGDVAKTGQSRVALDVGKDAHHFANPLLPKTRSEVALPLEVGERVLGVLDVQSVQSNAFTRDDVSILQVLADQLAIAIENVALFDQIQETLEAQRVAYGEISRDAWRQIIGTPGGIGYLCDAQGVTEPDHRWLPDMVAAYRQNQLVRADGTTLLIPIDIRDNVEGVVRLCKDESMGDWTEDEVEFMQSLVAQLSGTLDSARLYQETQLRAAHQQMLGKVTSRIRQTLDIETVLRTAVEQVRQTLGLPEVVVQLRNSAEIQAENAAE